LISLQELQFWNRASLLKLREVKVREVRTKVLRTFRVVQDQAVLKHQEGLEDLPQVVKVRLVEQLLLMWIQAEGKVVHKAVLKEVLKVVLKGVAHKVEHRTSPDMCL
jgi:hypothetical protein